jgi:hypothetical protein
MSSVVEVAGRRFLVFKPWVASPFGISRLNSLADDGVKHGGAALGIGSLLPREQR